MLLNVNAASTSERVLGVKSCSAASSDWSFGAESAAWSWVMVVVGSGWGGGCSGGAISAV